MQSHRALCLYVVVGSVILRKLAAILSLGAHQCRCATSTSAACTARLPARRAPCISAASTCTKPPMVVVSSEYHLNAPPRALLKIYNLAGISCILFIVLVALDQSCSFRQACCTHIVEKPIAPRFT